jgi:hypothetical protein
MFGANLKVSTQEPERTVPVPEITETKYWKYVTSSITM